METPNIHAGYFYPSAQRLKCGSFHQCTVTGKCQSYNPNNHACRLCESRNRIIIVEDNNTRIQTYLNGCLAEGEYMPDLQESQKVITEYLKQPVFAEANETVDMSKRLEAVDTYEKHAAQFQQFADLHKLKVYEEVGNSLNADAQGRLRRK